MANKEVHKDENGEYVLMESGPKGNHLFTKVYLDELGYDPREMKCKNCGEVIRKADFNDYLIHAREGMGRIWCYPDLNPTTDEAALLTAEPEESDA